jgi:hypothetical protein
LSPPSHAPSPAPSLLPLSSVPSTAPTPDPPLTTSPTGDSDQGKQEEEEEKDTSWSFVAGD